MDCFDVTILGCGSAKPTLRHQPSAQAIGWRGNVMLVDCGEGVQTALLRSRIPMSRVGHVFLSHLHGDHCLGLVGLLSTMGLGDRRGEVVIHTEPSAERIFRPLLDFFCPQLTMDVRFASHDPRRVAVVYEDDAIAVTTVPLCHRVPTAGFVFREKMRQPHLNVERARSLGIPVEYYRLIKQGRDWTCADGRVVPNAELTLPPTPSRSYAYVSDTMYPADDTGVADTVAACVDGVDVLYHEATYSHDMLTKARERGHSTARQAAEMAQRAGVGRLVLGHFSSQYHTAEQEQSLLDEARAVFENTILAREGLSVDIATSLPEVGRKG